MRQCNECNVCCQALGFKSKPEDFRCEWIAGLLSDQDRPDRSNVLLTLEPMQVPTEKRSLVAIEVVEGALNDHSMLDVIAKTRLIVIKQHNKRRYIGPAIAVEDVQRMLSMERHQ